MQPSIRDRAQQIWQQLAARNHWQLWADEAAFLDQVVAAATLDSDQEPTDQALRATIQRLYSERLYHGNVNREGRAAEELQRMFLRLALGGGVRAFEAEDIAQEAIARVLSKLAQVHSPQQFLAWALMVFRTTQRDLRPKREHSVLNLTEADQAPLDLPDSHDLVAAIEQRLLAQELCDQLRVALPNHLERLTLLRCVLLGDDPRDVAHDLGLPLYRTRSAKSRALQRLRAHATFMPWLTSYCLPPSGGSSHA